MNGKLNKFIFKQEQPSRKRITLCNIFYIIMMPLCLYLYLPFLGNFNSNVSASEQRDIQFNELIKHYDLIKTEKKNMQKIIDVYEQKLNIRPIIEQHIMKVNNKVFPQLAQIISNGIIEAEKSYPNIPYSIILAVMELESTFKYTAKSNKDCIGLMQVNPSVWLTEDNTDNLIEAGIVSNFNDLYDPTKNILAGTFILNHYYDQVDSENIKDKWEGALNKYFGTDSTDYFEKFQQFFGNFNLYMASYKTILKG